MPLWHGQVQHASCCRLLRWGFRFNLLILILLHILETVNTSITYYGKQNTISTSNVLFYRLISSCFTLYFIHSASSAYMEWWMSGFYSYNSRWYYNTVLPVHLFNPYPTAFPYGNGMVLHFYQQQESSTTKTVHKVINRGLKAYV